MGRSSQSTCIRMIGETEMEKGECALSKYRLFLTWSTVQLLIFPQASSCRVFLGIKIYRIRVGTWTIHKNWSFPKSSGENSRNKQLDKVQGSVSNRNCTSCTLSVLELATNFVFSCRRYRFYFLILAH